MLIETFHAMCAYYDVSEKLLSQMIAEGLPYSRFENKVGKPYVFNNPNKSAVGNILFAWHDTKPTRKNESQLIVILNDKNNMARGVEDAFSNYEAKVIRWSERDKESNIALLAVS